MLTVRRVSEVLIQAAERLIDHPEYDVAVGIRDDIPLRSEVLESCCIDLPQLLETTQTAGEPLAWSR